MKEPSFPNSKTWQALPFLKYPLNPMTTMANPSPLRSSSLLDEHNAWRDVTIYHAHVYFEAHQEDVAKHVHALVATAWSQLALAPIFRQPFGPHPMGNFQIVVPVSDFSDFARWVSFNRHGLSVLLHPITVNQVADHSDNCLWVGASLPNLDLAFLAKFDAALDKMGLTDEEILENVAYLQPDFVAKVRAHF
ncbi:Aste57867_21135 [Aphanomyces stellatus]|uniref:Aste57867_21135 protein n=1 Tax=Aphanomyces stellatus TaxID=120398 RepID=A0A485LGV0_9STRA|nr:hypothetical protein As57867_021067 [Aphanomyces stellatus]VFT97809.1 Aste57867_21135 [Aphanomyces stellatus]